MKFGGRWLYQHQGFAYSGNEGILGHFDYSGTFTGFGFADFLLDEVSQKGRGGAGGAVHAARHRVGIYAQDDFRVRDNLTLNLGLTWEYTSPLGREGRPPVEHRSRRPGSCCWPARTATAARSTTRTTAAGSRASALPGRRLRTMGRARRLRDRAVHGGHRQEPAASREPAVQLRGPANVTT